MIVLIDTNVILDFLLTREPAYQAASDIILKCANKEIKGYIAFHSISTDLFRFVVYHMVFIIHIILFFFSFVHIFSF